MTIGESISAPGRIQAVVEHVLSNPKVQTGTATGTIGVAVDIKMMELIPTYIAVIGGTLGIILTSMMIIHKWLQIRIELKGD